MTDHTRNNKHYRHFSLPAFSLLCPHENRAKFCALWAKCGQTAYYNLLGDSPNQFTVTFPEYRKVRSRQFNWIGGTLYIAWSIFFWLPTVAYMLIFRRPR